jgi:hypothetical protein
MATIKLPDIVYRFLAGSAVPITVWAWHLSTEVALLRESVHGLQDHITEVTKQGRETNKMLLGRIDAVEEHALKNATEVARLNGRLDSRMDSDD